MGGGAELIRRRRIEEGKVVAFFQLPSLPAPDRSSILVSPVPGLKAASCCGLIFVMVSCQAGDEFLSQDGPRCSGQTGRPPISTT